MIATVLAFVVGAFAYMFVGYGYGKISNLLYFDNRENYEIGFFRRQVRLLFFPERYHRWSKREIEKDSCGWIRKEVGAHPPTASKESKDKYCKANAFIWPLQLIPLLIGSVQLIFKPIVVLGTVIIPNLFNLLDSMTSRIGGFILKNKFFRLRRDESSLGYLRYLCEAEMKDQLRSLESLCEKIRQKRIRLATARGGLISLMNFEEATEREKERHKAVIKVLRQKSREMKKNEKSVRKDIVAIRNLIKDTKRKLATVEAYERASELVRESNVKNASVAVKKELSLVVGAYEDISSRASALEREYHSRLDIPANEHAELLADSFIDEEEKRKGLRLIG